MNSAAAGLDVASRAVDSVGIDVCRVQLTASQKIAERGTDGPGTAAQIHDDGSGLGDHRCHPHQELRATPRDEHTGIHRHPRPAEISPPHDVFQGQSAEPLIHHAAELVRMVGGLDEQLRFIFRENTAGGAQGGRNVGSPGHEGHASQGVPKVLRFWLGYEAWEH